MFRLFKRKTKPLALQLPFCIVQILNKVQMKFARYLKKNENKVSPKQKLIILIAFSILTIFVHALNLFKINRGRIENRPFPSHQRLSTPKDITLPDSLDVNLIRLYRDMERKQDSLNKQNPK